MAEITRIACPWLSGTVELTEERERHIRANRPHRLPDHRKRSIEAVTRPERVRRSARVRDAKLFSRWYDDVRGGKHVAVVIPSEPAAGGFRHWIVTAYLARRIAQGGIAWERG